MEQSQEIKKLNQHIIQVKCHAIRDMQVEEKETRQYATKLQKRSIF